MTYLLSSKRDSSLNPAITDSPIQSPKRIKTPQRAIPKLTKACLNQIWGDLKKLPLTGRVTYIQNNQLNPTLRAWFLKKIAQDKIIPQLKAALEPETTLTLFQDIKRLCTTEYQGLFIYSPEIFHSVFKPMIKEIKDQRVREISITRLQSLCQKPSADDPDIQNMLKFYYTADIKEDEDLISFCLNPACVTKLIVSRNICRHVKNLQMIAEAIKQSTILTDLYLPSCQITDEGAIIIAELLKVNTTIKFLSIYNNGICDEGAKAIAEALKQNKSLMCLHFARNFMQDGGLQAIAEALKQNTRLTKVYLDNPKKNKPPELITDKRIEFIY